MECKNKASAFSFHVFCGESQMTTNIFRAEPAVNNALYGESQDPAAFEAAVK